MKCIYVLRDASTKTLVMFRLNTPLALEWDIQTHLQHHAANYQDNAPGHDAQAKLCQEQNLKLFQAQLTSWCSGLFHLNKTGMCVLSCDCFFSQQCDNRLDKFRNKWYLYILIDTDVVFDPEYSVQGGHSLHNILVPQWTGVKQDQCDPCVFLRCINTPSLGVDITLSCHIYSYLILPRGIWSCDICQNRLYYEWVGIAQYRYFFVKYSDAFDGDPNFGKFENIVLCT